MRSAYLLALVLLAACQPQASAPPAPAAEAQAPSSANAEAPVANADDPTAAPATDAAPVPAPAEVPPPIAPAGVATVDTWLGTWTGPEGTSLQLSRAGNSPDYALVITNLDGPSTFNAVVVGDHLMFERNGVQETLRASNGAATGMKWLQDKKDCLTINAGEGFCRD